MEQQEEENVQMDTIPFRVQIRPRPEDLFQSQRTVITVEADSILNRVRVYRAIRDHRRGEWTCSSELDRWGNDEAILKGGSVVSVHRDVSRRKFLVVTEEDRSVTTVRMAQELRSIPPEVACGRYTGWFNADTKFSIKAP